jgi:pSer/pThr/pTyr-binding forkhead associated (FHA) protein
MQLTFPNGEHASVAFEQGEISIGSRAGQSVSLPGKSLAPHHASLVWDRRGLWLRVPAGTPGVHLNARPIRRIALLRIGDQLCLEQVQMVLSENSPDVIDRIIPPATPAALTEAQRVSASRVAIRGISGNLCGRAFTLTEPKLVGRGSACDIRIDDPAVAERECQFELHGDRVILRSLSHGEFTTVNGVPVADAVLAPGDQVVIDQHRFIVEAPGLPPRGQDRLRGQVQQQHTQTMKAVRVPQSSPSSGDQRESLDPPPPQPVDPGALWWLIAAAAVLAAAMTALLVYSPHMGAA